MIAFTLSIVTNATNDAASSRRVIHVSCSTHAGPAEFAEDLSAEGCAPEDIHLTAVDETLKESQCCGKYLALCGEVIARSDLPGTLCVADCEREHGYCLACIREANRRNWQAGLDVDCPPGVIVRTSR